MGTTPTAPVPRCGAGLVFRPTPSLNPGLDVLYTGSDGRFGHGGLVVTDLAPLRSLIRTYAAAQ